MHNSQNSASSKVSFASTLLAQAKLLDIPTPSSEVSNLDIQTISNAIINKTKQKTNVKVSEVPTFYQIKEEEKYTDIGLPLSEVVATFARRAKSVYESFLISERGQELLSKADEYEIPYNANDINFLELLDQVEEFEEVIARAEKFGIDWQDFGYDIIAIEQQIEESVLEEASYRKYAYLDFIAAIRVGA